MNTIQKYSTLVKSISHLEFLSAIVKNKIASEKKDSFTPENYFFLTDLVNPAKAYWDRKSPQTQESNELSRRLFLGKKLERFAGFWFRKIPNFFVEEGILDGLYADIPGVRGALDFKIGDAIIEFKTKDNLPKDIKDVYENYPQDLEQLSFYSVIHPLRPKENYLVFMDNTSPYELKVFKAVINDFGKIKDLILRRMKLLKKAIENNDPAELGQCRYCNNHCQYEDNGVCSCSNIPPLSTKVLQSAIEITYDGEFTEMLESEKSKSKIPEDMFTTFNIIAPRKLLMERMGIHEEWKSDNQREEYLACLGNLVRKLPMQLNDEQSEIIKDSIKEPRMHIAHKWLNVKTSIKPEGEILPYIIKKSDIGMIENIRGPSQYAVAEIGIICSAYSKIKGLIFVVYPKLDDLVQVYQVEFKNVNEIQNELRNRVDLVERAVKDIEISSVDFCPDFMCNNQCPIYNKCFPGKG